MSLAQYRARPPAEANYRRLRRIQSPDPPGPRATASESVLFVFGIGWIGTRIYQEMPPIPARIVDSAGNVVVADGDIGRGQNVWQALGSMEVGSIWGRQLRGA